MLDPPAVPDRARLQLGRALGPAAICALVLIVNIPALAHLVDVNPLDKLAQLTTARSNGFLPGLDTLDPDIGWTAQALGHRAALDWLHGQIPWWNPFEGIGVPLAAEMQAAAFFPPVLLFALADGSLYFHIFIELAAGLGTYFLLRELELSRPVASVGGALFALNGTFSWVWHAPMNPVAFLPLALLGVERLARKPRSNSGWVILALGIALSFYAGFPETAYLDALFVLAWAVFRLVQARRVQWRPLALGLALGGVVGLLLSLPLALPFAQYLPTAYTGQHAIGYSPLSSVDIPILGMPYLYGPLFAFNSHAPALNMYFGPVGGFVGLATLVLAVAGLVSSRRSLGFRLLLAAVALVSLAWSFGIEPFTQLTNLLPYADHVMVARYVAADWELAFVVLAALGLESLRPSKDPNPRTSIAPRNGLLAGIGVVALLAVAAALSAPGSSASKLLHVAATRGYVTAALAWGAAVAIVVALVALVTRLRQTRWAGVIVGTVLILDAATMAFLPQLSSPRSATVDTRVAAYLAQHLGLDRFYSIGSFHSDYGAYFGTASVDTTDLPIPSAWATETGKLAPNTVPFKFDGRVVDQKGPSALKMFLARLPQYEALGVRYLVIGGGRPSPTIEHAGLRLVYDDGSASVYLVPHPGTYWSAAGGSCTLSSATLDAITATCTRTATLVRAGLYMPGWAATVNGSPTPVHDSGALLTAIRIPAGRSEVAFSYAPPHTDLALAGFLVGLLLLIGVPLAPPAIARLRRRRLA